MAGYVSTYALLRDFLTTVAGYAPDKVMRRAPSNLVTIVPLIVVDRFGGGDRRLTLDVARVDIDYFASTEDTAEAGGEAVRTWLRSQLHGHMFGGAVVSKLETISAPTLRDWEVGGSVFRTVATYQVTIHQYSGVSAA